MTISWPVNEDGHGTRSVPWICGSMTAASTAVTTPDTAAAAEQGDHDHRGLSDRRVLLGGKSGRSRYGYGVVSSIALEGRETTTAILARFRQSCAAVAHDTTCIPRRA